MDENQKNKTGFIGVTLAASVAIVVGEGPFSLWSSITGIVLLLFLHASHLRFKKETPKVELLAYGAVWSLCFLLVIGFLLNYIRDERVLQISQQIEGTEKWETVASPFDPFTPRDLIGFGIWGVTTLIVAFTVWYRNRLNA
ncbi:MAG: hypothetical protein DRH17_13835 [Deltaproteobacteria bacterium]|nr:MAG: hypothetical protein DRH17_13835 [Deltaproteobacteria bacterium]